MAKMDSGAKRFFLGCLFFLLLAIGCADNDASTGSEPTGDDDDMPAPLALTVLHTNDTHAHLAPFNNYGADCTDSDLEENSCYGGVARWAAQIDAIRAVSGNVLAVDAGDQFQGTLFYTYFKSDAIWPFMNLIAYDAMTLGNHEFDDGPETLGDYLGHLDLPPVCSNIDVSAEPALAGRIARSRIVEIDGQQIGLVGALTTATATLSQPGDRIDFFDPIESLRAAVAEFTAQGVNKIIALTHLGYEVDLEVAAAVEGLDVIVGGHSHDYLADDPDAAGPYPTEVASPAGEPVLVVTAYQWGKFLGRLDIVFDAQGVAQSWTGGPILLDQTVTPKTEVQVLVDQMQQELNEFAGEIVGETLVDLDGSEESCRGGECNLGDVIADAMLWENAAEGVQVALFNAGSIKASLMAGDITVGDVLGVLPYINTLATLKLVGSDLLAALEYAVGLAENPAAEGTGRFLQVAGIRFVWDVAAPAGSRIAGAEIRDADGEYQPLDEAAIYGIVCTDYLRGGGDGFTVFAEKAIDPYDYGRLLTEVWIDYLKLYSPIDTEVEGRITLVD